MASGENQEETRDKDGLFVWKRHGKLLFLGGLVSLGVMAFGGWLVHLCVKPPPPVVRTEGETLGFLCLQEAMQAHEEYGKLEDLRNECKVLREELKSMVQPEGLMPPALDAKPFDDSVWQKNAQNIVGQRTELEKERRQAADAYRAKTEDDYLAKREALNAKYVNAMMELRLKLDNADVLHLSEELVGMLSEKLSALQQERLELMQVLAANREAEVEEASRAAIAEKLDAWKAEAMASKQQLEAEKARALSEAQARDAAAMAAQMEAPIRFQNAMQKRQALEEKEQEVLSLESHILNDVAGKAARLAILHHFTMIVANPATRLEALIPWENRVGAPAERYEPVVGSDVTDITEELVAELRH